MVFAAGVVVPSLAWVDLASFEDTAILTPGAGVVVVLTLGAAVAVAVGVVVAVVAMLGVVVAVVCTADAAGFVIAGLAGVALCWAKALIGRIAKEIAANRLETRVMVGVLCTGGSLVAPG
jgi:hypothetical protein